MTQKEVVEKAFSDNFELINKRIETSQYPYTFKLLLRFDRKIEFLVTSIKEASIHNNFYSSQVLTRIIIEHFLVAYYVWTKARIDENDECATEYYAFYGLQELMKQDNYNAKLDKTYDQTKTPLQNVAVGDPETFGDISEADILDLNQRANKFDIRKILVFLRDELDINDEFKPLHTIVHDYCKRYNRLSTFIHGGPTAELQTFENKPQTNHLEVSIANLENGEMISYQIKSFIFLLLICENKEYIDIYKPVLEFINQK